MGNFAGEFFTGWRQDEAAILFVFEQSFGAEALDHVSHAGLGNFQGGGDIDDAGVTFGIHQFEDALELILDCGRTTQCRRGFFWHSQIMEQVD